MIYPTSPRPPSEWRIILRFVLAWASAGAAMGAMASLWDWNLEPARVTGYETLVEFVTWRVLSCMAYVLVGGLLAYTVARPVKPPELFHVYFIAVPLSLGSPSLAGVVRRLLFIVVPLGLAYGAFVRIGRNRSGAARSTEGETVGRAEA